MSQSAASLHVIGNDLDPEEVTRLLGVGPTSAEAKGDRVEMPSGKLRVAKTGHWRLKTDRRSPADLDGQISELFSVTSQDLDDWATLRKRFVIRVFCGLMMSDWNEGLPLTALTIQALAERGAEIDLDLYAPDTEG